MINIPIKRDEKGRFIKMQYRINNSKLTLTAENQTDQSILLNLWSYPIILRIKRPQFRFGEHDNRAVLTTTKYKEQIMVERDEKGRFIKR